MTLLQINKLSHYFGGLLAVDNLNLTIEEGELIGLIGPNGAGKTTVFNLVTGAYRASEGQILFHGEDLVGKAPHVINGMGISRTFQTIRLWNMMTVLDNVRIAQHSQISYSLADAFLRLPRYRKQEREIEERSMSCCACSTWTATRRSRSEPPMASSAGSRSCAPWPPGPSCCCWTSRQPA